MPRILVVDDSAVERRLVGGLLEKGEGYEIDYANDGVMALQKIAAARPDLVLTDLRMPELDGLQLVRQIKLGGTDVPVVLMTAHGSEEIALEALEAGAATYVPKDQLADGLLNAVGRVLAMSAADRTSTELTECLKGTQLEFELDNDPSLIDPLVQFVQNNIQSVGFSGSSRIQLAVALEQALLSALYRGNLEITEDELEAACESQLLGDAADLVSQRRSQPPYRERRIQVRVSVIPQEVRFCVKDEGPGFDVHNLIKPLPEAVAEGGRGRAILLMKTFMDEVHFNDLGNEVTLVKRADT
jgi:CheY-like chemotaxis protein